MEILARDRETGRPFVSEEGFLSMLGPYRGGRRRRGLRDRHVYMAKTGILLPDGTEISDGIWRPNVLADEGEASIINVYLREQSNPTKFLAILNDAGIAETDTMATMVEAETPGTDGYARPALAAGDWGAPALDSGDHQTTGAQESIGPNTGAAWTPTHVAFVTTSTGTSGLLLGYVATAVNSVGTGVTFLVTPRWKLQ